MRVRGTVAAGVCALVAPALALSGCSGDATGAARSSASSSARASGSSATSAASVASAAASTSPSAPTALTRMSPREHPCEGCAAFQRELRKRKKQGWTVDLSGVRVRGMHSTRLDETISVVRSTVDVPSSRSVNHDGSFRSSNQGHRGVVFEVAMRHTKKRYQLLSFTVG